MLYIVYVMFYTPCDEGVCVTLACATGGFAGLMARACVNFGGLCGCVSLKLGGGSGESQPDNLTLQSKTN